MSISTELSEVAVQVGCAVLGAGLGAVWGRSASAGPSISLGKQNHLNNVSISQTTLQVTQDNRVFITSSQANSVAAQERPRGSTGSSTGPGAEVLLFAGAILLFAAVQYLRYQDEVILAVSSIAVLEFARAERVAERATLGSLLEEGPDTLFFVVYQVLGIAVLVFALSFVLLQTVKVHAVVDVAARTRDRPGYRPGALSTFLLRAWKPPRERPPGKSAGREARHEREGERRWRHPPPGHGPNGRPRDGSPGSWSASTGTVAWSSTARPGAVRG